MPNEFVKIGDKIKKPSGNKLFIQPSKILDVVKEKQPSFIAAHITDIHIKTANSVFQNRYPVLKASLMSRQFDYILNTGDTADQPDPVSTIASVEQFVTDMNAIKPMIVARGNHDYGHTNATIGMPVNNYYYQDIGNKWRVIVLYSQGGGNYAFGSTQLAWLTDLLSKSSEKHVCIMSHVPVMGVAGMMWYVYNQHANPVSNTVWNPTVDFHKDVYAVSEIIRQYKSIIKVWLSGHQHTIDDCVYFDVRHLCSGSICADWWNSTDYQEKHNRAGYRLIKFYDDGTIDYEFVYY